MRICVHVDVYACMSPSLYIDIPSIHGAYLPGALGKSRLIRFCPGHGVHEYICISIFVCVFVCICGCVYMRII